jgi:glycosyltransferase involved in cell wall biosynthesis
LISVVIPTITGREYWLGRALEAFEEHETIVVKDKPTCGIAWNTGIPQCNGDYILLAADDVEPADPMWIEAGTYWVDKGYLPCARILNSDHSLQSCGDWVQEMDTGTVCRFARIPFATRAQMETIQPIIETHYFTDVWFSEMGRKHGWPTVVVREFCFYHHYAPEGRLDHRMAPDQREYEKRIRGLA